MQFKTCQLIIETSNKIEDDMNTVVTLGNSKMIYNNEIYYIIKKIVKKKYLWLYCQYDNAKLYGDIVVDTKNEKEHKNTRKKTNIELRQQLFVVYDFDSHVLYLNNINKKNFVKKYIAEILQVEVTIKNIYASLIEFQNSIKALKKLKFTQYYNIMNAGKKNTIFMQQVNELGLDMPDKITMQIEYPNIPIGSIKNGLQNIKERRDMGIFQDIVLIGIDDTGVEQHFDFTSLIKNIDLNVEKNENERFDPAEIEKCFFQRIGEEHVF